MDRGPIALKFIREASYAGSAIGRIVTLPRKTVRRLSGWAGRKYLDRTSGREITGSGMRTGMEELAKFVRILVHEVGHVTWSTRFGHGSGVYNQFEGPDFRTYGWEDSVFPIPRVPERPLEGVEKRHWINEWAGSACRGLVLGARADGSSASAQAVHDAVVYGLDEAHVLACQQKVRAEMSSADEREWQRQFGADGYGGRADPWTPCYSERCVPGIVS